MVEAATITFVAKNARFTAPSSLRYFEVPPNLPPDVPGGHFSADCPSLDGNGRPLDIRSCSRGREVARSRGATLLRGEAHALDHGFDGALPCTGCWWRNGGGKSIGARIHESERHACRPIHEGNSRNAGPAGLCSIRRRRLEWWLRNRGWRELECGHGRPSISSRSESERVRLQRRDDRRSDSRVPQALSCLHSRIESAAWFAVPAGCCRGRFGHRSRGERYARLRGALRGTGVQLRISRRGLQVQGTERRGHLHQHQMPGKRRDPALQQLLEHNRFARSVLPGGSGRRCDQAGECTSCGRRRATRARREPHYGIRTSWLSVRGGREGLDPAGPLPSQHAAIGGQPSDGHDRDDRRTCIRNSPPAGVGAGHLPVALEGRHVRPAGEASRAFSERRGFECLRA